MDILEFSWIYFRTNGCTPGYIHILSIHVLRRSIQRQAALQKLAKTAPVEAGRVTSGPELLREARGWDQRG